MTHSHFARTDATPVATWKVASGVFAIQGIVVAVSFGHLMANGVTSGSVFDLHLTKYLSLAQLVVVAGLALAIAVQRYVQDGNLRRCPVWMLIGVGFLYLAVESTLGVNEYIETHIEKISGVSDTDWTRRIDDALLAVAGVCGAAILLMYYHELSRSRAALRMFMAAVVVLLGMVAFDIATAQLDFVFPTFRRAPVTPATFAALELFEDLLMLIGEGLFFVAMYESGWMVRELEEPKGEKSILASRWKDSRTL